MAKFEKFLGELNNQERENEAFDYVRAIGKILYLEIVSGSELLLPDARNSLRQWQGRHASAILDLQALDQGLDTFGDITNKDDVKDGVVEAFLDLPQVLAAQPSLEI